MLILPSSLHFFCFYLKIFLSWTRIHSPALLGRYSFPNTIFKIRFPVNCKKILNHKIIGSSRFSCTCWEQDTIKWRCGGSLVALQTAEAVVPGSNPASLTVENSEDRQSHCVYCKISGQRGRPPPGAKKKKEKKEKKIPGYH